MLVSPLIDPLLHGKWRRYRSIRADDLAAAAIALTGQKASGHFVHDHDAIRYAIRREELQVRAVMREGGQNSQLRRGRG